MEWGYKFNIKFSGLLFLSSILCPAQNDFFLTHYQPSPESYSLMQYTDCPVSYYTGVPEINIPLYEIKVGDFTLPVTLKYHASGIKISQESSKIGLGWSLHAGGEISRSIRGFDDFYGNQIHTGMSLEDDFSRRGYWMDTCSFYVGERLSRLIFPDTYNIYADPQPDGEPDVFYYNFGKFSGIFYAKRGAGQTSEQNKFILKNPEDNIFIEYQDSIGYDLPFGIFTITDTDGIKYVFANISSEKNLSQVIYEGDENDGYMCDRHSCSYYPIIPEANIINNIGDVAVSWRLSKITLPSGEEILFTYNDIQNNYYSPIAVSYKDVYPIGEPSIFVPEYNDAVVYMNMAVPKSCTIQSVNILTHEASLKSIVWPEGKIVFNSDSVVRQDIRTFQPAHSYHQDQYNAHALDNITVFSSSPSGYEPHEKIQFHHSYFGKHTTGYEANTYLKYRLRLDSISLHGRLADRFISEKCHRYIMKYDMTHDLPEKNSNFCDLWGYYTGDDREALIAPYVAQTDYYRLYKSHNNLRLSTSKFISEGSHSFDEFPRNTPNIEYRKTWTLTSLTNPLGGTTRFEYGCNEVDNEGKTEIVFTDSVQNSSFKSERAFAIPERPSDIEMTDTLIYVPFERGNIELDCTYIGGTEERTDTIVLLKLYDSEGNILLSQRGLPQDALIEHYAETLANFHLEREFNTSGFYRLSLPTNRTWIRKMEVNLTIHEAVEKEVPVFAGGLRIEKIISPISTRIFEYVNKDPVNSHNIHRSSGQINRQPSYAQPKTTLVFANGVGVIGAWYHLDNYSYPCQPLDNPHGGTQMGYSVVHVNQVDTINNITLTDSYFFHNEKEPPMRDYGDMGKDIPLNGKLLKHIIWRNGEMAKKQIYNYSTRKVASIPTVYQYGGNDTYNTTWINNDFPILTYSWSRSSPIDSVITYHTFLDSKHEITHDKEASSDSLVRHTTYLYNNEDFLISDIISSSPGERTQRLAYKYPIDLLDRDSTILAMHNHHLLSRCLQETTYTDDVPTKKHISKYYDIYPYNLAQEFNYIGRENMPDVLDVYEGNINYPADKSYYYNSKSKPVQIESRMKQSIVLLWGYNHQHIIAQINNATLQQVDSISSLDFDALANRPQPLESEWDEIQNLRNLMPQSAITIYKYAPLVGVVEEIDPNGRTTLYEYDEFNRLTGVYEKEGTNENLVQKYEYHYATEN